MCFMSGYDVAQSSLICKQLGMLEAFSNIPPLQAGGKAELGWMSNGQMRLGQFHTQWFS